MKLTIKNIQRYTKDKDGNDLKTKDGRSYERVTIRTQEHGERALSGFGGFWNMKWKEGDMINVDIDETAGRDGTKYLNFKKPDPFKALEARIEKVEVWIKAEIAKKPKESTIKYPPEVDDYQEENMGY